MKSRSDPRFSSFSFSSVVSVPPYVKTPIRSRSGLKKTAFHETVGRFAKSYKLHNTYLKPDYFTDPLEEYWAIRRVAGLLDVTGEEVLEITGPDAVALVDNLNPRDTHKMKDGMCYYSVLCHAHGGIVEDGIIARFTEERLWWIGGPGNAEELLYADSIGRDVKVESFNDRLHVASLQGPQSRDILQGCFDADLSAVPFYGLVGGKVCGVDVTISRTGYTAELGYDIYVPVSEGAAFFEALWSVVDRAGGQLCGSRSLGIRRIEASILNFGQDFDWQHNPAEIGLGWMISETKAPWRAGPALLKAKHAPPAHRIVGLRFAGEDIPLVGDDVRVADRVLGQITSATGSPTLGYPIAMALVTEDVPVGTRVEVEGGDQALVADVVPMPFFDPERKLMKVL